MALYTTGFLREACVICHITMSPFSDFTLLSGMSSCLSVCVCVCVCVCVYVCVYALCYIHTDIQVPPARTSIPSYTHTLHTPRYTQKSLHTNTHTHTHTHTHNQSWVRKTGIMCT